MHNLHLPHDIPLFLRLLPWGGRLSLIPFNSMVELGWPMSDITAEHLQNLVSQGYMSGVELATCHVPADPTSPAPVVGYVVFTQKL
jgi:hypothetical protein